ncbi:hypothetical protein P4O66_001688 [Electrophorus voltai]|uniref:Uncharacterized protein n=1 Tax=Electrophorus voltai TaxID=2609070 RepID=A0AAD8Z7H7_9TELE|nr:hypothetical protein P4O66_001688 [Electrophorus voltai]
MRSVLPADLRVEIGDGRNKEQTPTTEESATGGFWGATECGPGSDSAESYRPMSDSRDWYNEVQYSESDSAGFCYPTMEVYVDSERKGEYSNISLRSVFESNREEDPSMEEEEVLHSDPPSVSNTADSESDKPPAPKVPPKACFWFFLVIGIFLEKGNGNGQEADDGREADDERLMMGGC